MRKILFFNSIIFYLFFLTLSGCYKGKSVDLVIHNAKIHTMNEHNTIVEAMAIKDGIIIETGPERQILNKYTSKKEIDAGGRDIYPGFTDAHGHIISLAKKKLGVDLIGTRSYDELLVRLEKYNQRKNRKFIIGRGWDQSLWNQTEMPTNEKINLLFPDKPVCLFRIDGHAILVNDAFLQKVNITPQTIVDGGINTVKNGRCTGLLIDNAMNAVLSLIPPYSKSEMKKTILSIQNDLFQYGITGVHEAGIEYDEMRLFRELVDSKKLTLNLYAMLLPTKKNIAFAKKNGIFRDHNLSIRSFKVFGDGALGSHGAFLKQEYNDQHNHFGMLTTTHQDLKRIALICELTGYQMNCHAIGDSTNHLILDLYKTIYETNRDHRWRIEHAQIIDPKDFKFFSQYGVFPSVQPTHAVSDQRWVESRLGKKRLAGAYAYNTLLRQTGMIAIGTDFPVEQINPFLTIHAAVQRKDQDNFPNSGFLINEAISFNNCIKGMTIWPAFASFQEKELGTLEKGKHATFAIFEKPVISSSEFKNNYAYMTFIKGQKVYSIE